MRIAANPSVIVCCVVGLFACGASAQAPTFSLVVGAVNGERLPEPVSSIDAEPGDILRVWILLRDWSTPAGQRLRAYQATIDYVGYLSGCAGNVYPVGFAETTDLYGHCTKGGPVGIPNPNAFIDTGHEDPDFVFLGSPSAVVTTNTLLCDYRFLGSLIFPNPWAPLGAPGVRYYCGTVDLQASADAAGVFTVGFAEDDTLLRDENSGEIPIYAFENLTITLPDGEPYAVASDPPDGAIDARQPSDLECTEFFGWDAIEITFDCEGSAVYASDFTVTVDPADMDPPVIVVVEPDGNVATLRFDVSIPTRHWTVVTHNRTGWSTRIGYLPGDVNGDGTTSTVDILDMIDYFPCWPPFPPEWSMDVNRSGEFNPADILTLIDLLNGAGCFDPWNGETLPG